MRKLLAANHARLAGAKSLWITAAGVFAFMLYAVLQGGRVDARNGLGRDLDYYYFQLLPLLGVVISVFIALFFGTEYSDGTIRNKLIVGHTRYDIYLSNLFTCFSGVAVIILAWLLGGLAGIPYFGVWSVGISTFAEYALIAVLSILAIATILVAESQIISNKALSAVVIIFTALALILLGSYFHNALQEPETTFSSITISSDGIEYGPEIANPAYIGGTLRKVYQAMLCIVPTGQAFLIAKKEVSQPIFMCACSLAIIAVSTIIGVILFHKKDIK